MGATEAAAALSGLGARARIEILSVVLPGVVTLAEVALATHGAPNLRAQVEEGLGSGRPSAALGVTLGFSLALLFWALGYSCESSSRCREPRSPGARLRRWDRASFARAA
jgi:hypothetical protein